MHTGMCGRMEAIPVAAGANCTHARARAFRSASGAPAPLRLHVSPGVLGMGIPDLFVSLSGCFPACTSNPAPPKRHIRGPYLCSLRAVSRNGSGRAPAPAFPLQGDPVRRGQPKGPQGPWRQTSSGLAQHCPQLEPPQKKLPAPASPGPVVRGRFASACSGCPACP